MKKRIFLLPFLLFTLTLFIFALTNVKVNATETLEMYFTQGGNRISSITIAPGSSATVDFYINVEGAQAKFAQTAIAGINLRNGYNTTTVKVASDMPAGHYYLVGSYNGYSVMLDLFVTEPPHTCVYSSSSVLSNPTCSAEGVKKYSCTCGNSYTEAIPKIAHTYSSTVIAPTCSSKGYTKYTCSVCSYSYNADETAKLAHTPKALSAVASTCTSTGLTAGSKCSVCNEPIVAQEITPKLEHNYSSWNTLITPTCTKEGKKQRTCSRCNNVESATLEKTDHSWNSSYTVDKKATCTAEGTKSIHCKDCTATKNSTSIPKAEHTVVTLAQKPATCTSTGLTAGSKCSSCNTTIVAQEVTPKTDHNYSSWNTLITPTCSKEGKKQRSCSSCNNVESATLEKTDHSWNSSYTVDKKATCTAEGTKSIHCKNCSVTKNSTSIPKAEHTIVTLAQKPATCTSTGLTAGSKCSVCNKTIVAQEITPKTDHGWNSSYTVDKKATCTAEGTKSIHCKDCTATKNSTSIPKAEHTIVTLAQKPATCNSTGLTAGSKCSVCNETIVAQQTIDKLSHSYGSWKTVSASTCVREGKEQRICSLCNNVETKSLEKSDHKEIAGKTQNVHSKCPVCNETLSTKHTFNLTIENDSTADIYKYTCDCGYQYTKVIPISVCEHIDEDMNDLCDLCNENTSQKTTIYYKDCEDCNGSGCKVMIKNIRPIHTIRKSMIFKSTYTFHIANLMFFNARKDISLESTQKNKISFMYNTCTTCNGVGTLELTIEPDSSVIEDKAKKED